MPEESTERSRTSTGEPDPFLYDFDALRRVASEPVVKRGIAYYNEKRVVELDYDGSRLTALVQGSQPDGPYAVELTSDEVGQLWVQCECAVDDEPMCKHAIATLLAYEARASSPPDVLSSAAEAALEERAQRGRTEVRVKHLAGEPWLGTWSATSVASATHRRQTYTVHMRSLRERENFCTCPDLATNQLGTCKHIEAVLHRLRKRRDFARIAGRAPRVPYVHLAWDVPDAPRIRLRRTSGMASASRRLLDRYFDAAGFFVRRMPEDFFRLADTLQDRDDVLLGEDARQHALRLAEDAAHRERAARIREDIHGWGDRLPGLRARLYPYQVDGVAFLAANGRALLADDMGLGKTLQAIAAATWLAHHGDVRRVLVVCPASLKRQWEREITRFTDYPVQVVQGPPDGRRVQYRKGATFCIVNYELVLRDLSVINEDLAPDLLILDEAQRIKNWRTKVAASVKLIGSRLAFVLTGTPLENRLEDLYSLLQVVDARVLGPLWRVLVDFHVTDPRGKVIGYRNLGELRRRIAPVVLRRDRRLVRDQLPDRIEQRFDVPLNARQRELHDAGLSAAGTLANIARRRPLTPVEQNRLMAALQQARMACNAAGLVDRDLPPGSPKLDELASLLDELCVQSGLDAVVFSQWERMTVMVEQVVRRLGLGFVRLHGGVPTARRGALIDRFRDDDTVQVFISTDSGGVGLNLQNASVLVNLDIPWNPAVLEQRIARVHRLGQERNVQIMLLVAADSYEERVMQLVAGKQVLFDGVFGDDAGIDVVGVSRRALDALVDDLAGDLAGDQGAHKGEGPELLPAPVDQAATPVAGDGVQGPEDAAVQRLVEEVQRAFGPRIDRILGAGGGLLVVIDRVDARAEETARALSGETAVALIEPGTLAGLERLGAGSPLGAMRALYLGPREAAPSRASVHLDSAREKLRAAEALLALDDVLDHAAGALELLASSMLLAVCALSDRDQPLGPDEAVVWIYSEAVPSGVLTSEQGTALVRALSLRNATAVPEPLIAQVLADARELTSVGRPASV